MRVFVPAIVIILMVQYSWSAVESNNFRSNHTLNENIEITRTMSFPDAQRFFNDLAELRKKHKNEYDDTLFSRSLDKIMIFFSSRGFVYILEKIFKNISYVYGLSEISRNKFLIQTQ